MRILIAGGSGMIGTALTKTYLAEGHQVCLLTRNPGSVRLPFRAEAIAWDGRTVQGWEDQVERTAVVINLAGERLARWPWTQQQKQRFWDSRVNGGRALVQAIRKASTPPQVFLQASGVNYYGPHGFETVTEKDLAGTDFLGELSQAWEDSTAELDQLGVRRVILRSAIVLHAKEGILPLMLLPVKLFVGGPLASGKQGLPWIHLEDEVAAIRFLAENPDARGPYNLTAQDPVSSSEFLRVAAKMLRRPFWLPAPAFALRLVLGGMAVLLTQGVYLKPSRLQELGFSFRFGDLDLAMWNLLGK